MRDAAARTINEAIGEWVAVKQPDAFKELVRTESISKHYLSERGILYNRAELDVWLMNR